mgnify:FL=1
MTEQEIQNLRERTAQYAIEHITKEGMHRGIAWLRDSFNEYCEAIGANEFNPDDIGFDLEKLTSCLKREPWIAEIARKPETDRTWEDRQRVAQGFIRKYWPYEEKQRITVKDINDVLKVADPLSHRHLLAQKVAIDCIHALDQEQLQQLDEVLDDIARNPEQSQSRLAQR